MKNEVRYLSTFGCVCWWTVEAYSWKAMAWMGIGTSCGKRQGVYAELLRSAKSARSLNCSSRSRSWELGYCLGMYTWGLSDVFLRGRISTRFNFCFYFHCSFDEAIFDSKNETNLSLCNYVFIHLCWWTTTTTNENKTYPSTNKKLSFLGDCLSEIIYTLFIQISVALALFRDHNNIYQFKIECLLSWKVLISIVLI